MATTARSHEYRAAIATCNLSGSRAWSNVLASHTEQQKSLLMHTQAEEVEVETRGELIFLLVGAAIAFGAGIWYFMVRTGLPRSPALRLRHDCRVTGNVRCCHVNASA